MKPIVASFSWSDEAITHGHGMAFWYDPESGLHWGSTHYMIFHGLFGQPDIWNGLQNKGIFGWVFPDAYQDDKSTYKEPEYDISFGSDFGMAANKDNVSLEKEAVENIEGDIGYPAYDIFYTPKPEPHVVAKTGGVIDGSYYSCFGYLNGVLYLGSGHHMAIMKQLLLHGWTWEQLMEAQQLWGWFSNNEEKLVISFSTDAGFMNKNLINDVKEAFAKLTNLNIESFDDVGSTNKEQFAPAFEKDYGPEGIKQVPQVLMFNPQTGQKDFWEGQRLARVANKSPYGLPGEFYTCFGYIDGKLYLGTRHHMAIMQNLLTQKGWTWDQLMNARQVWGWIFCIRKGTTDAWYSKSIPSGEADYDETDINTGPSYGPGGDVETAPEDRGYFRATTDAAAIDVALIPQAGQALSQAFKMPFYFTQQIWQSNSDYAPKFHYNVDEDADPVINVEEFTPQEPAYNYGPTPSWKPEGLHMVPIKYNNPGQTYSSWQEDEEFNGLLARS